MVEPAANDDPTVHSFVEMEPVKNIDNPLRSRATSSGPSKSKRPLRSYGLTPYKGHSRTIKGVSEDHIRVYDYGPASYGGVDFGTELAYVDTRTEKILLYDKGWGLDPFDQENPDVLWVHGNTDVFNVPNFMVHFLEHMTAGQRIDIAFSGGGTTLQDLELRATAQRIEFPDNLITEAYI